MDASALSLSSPQTPKLAGQAYLKFYLSDNIPAVLPMHYAREALSLSLQRLTPMPNMPSYVLGLMHRHSQVLWVIDLVNFLDVGRIDATSRQYDIILLRVASSAFAIAVRRIEGITWLTAQDIQPPLNQVAPGLMSYLTGCVLKAQEVLLVLDAEAILQSPALQGHLPND